MSSTVETKSRISTTHTHRIRMYDPRERCFLCKKVLAPSLPGDRIDCVFTMHPSKKKPGEEYPLQHRVCPPCRQRGPRHPWTIR